MMTKHYKIVLFLILSSLFLGAGDSLGETKSILLQTYYPPPQAAYDLIRLFPRTDISNIPPTPCIYTDSVFNTGSMYMNKENNSIYFCKPDGNWGALSGIWMQNGTNIFLADNQTGIDRDSPSDGADINEIKVGFGTETPLFRLHLEGDGGILAAGSHLQLAVSGTPPLPTGLFVAPPPSGTSLSTNGAGTRFFWYPLKAAIRAGEVAGTQWDNASIGTLSVAFGHNTTAAGLGAMVHGGETNTISFTTSKFAAIFGGRGNAIICGSSSGSYSTIVGGLYNQIKTNDSFIGGGSGNQILGAAVQSGIGGGIGNIIQSANSAILGGANNQIPPPRPDDGSITIPNGTYSYYCGVCNPQDSPYSFIGGGRNNSITYNEKNVVFGGLNNYLDSLYSVIGGGSNNFIDAEEGMGILGGKDNFMGTGNQYCSIGGGQNNQSVSSDTTVGNVFGGGQDNSILKGDWTPDYSGIVGGQGNTLIGELGYSNPLGGYHFIGGGKENSSGSAPYDRLVSSTAIGGGLNNAVRGQSCFVGGGSNNNATGDFSVVPGGQNNTAAGPYSLAAGKNMQIVPLTPTTAGLEGMGTFAWGNSATPVTITQDKSFIIFPNAEGRVGIGTATPDAMLTIRANLSTDTALFLDDGFTLILDNPLPGDFLDCDLVGENDFIKYRNNPLGCPFDLAEIFDASASVSTGDVVAVDPQNAGKLKKSVQPYDTKVVGIVSSNPAVLLEGKSTHFSPGKNIATPTRPAVALAGRVLCKITLENGPVEYGDLLTSSSTPGYAMKATDAEKSFGAIVGKALEPFAGGPAGEKEGFITILVSLQ